MDEEKKEETEPATDTGEGDKPETDEKIERLNADTERINKAIAENENAKAREKIGGITAGAQPEEKKELTPKEYAESISKGIIPKD